MKGKIALATLAMIPMTANNAYASNIGTVTASSLNVRSGPSTSYTVVTTVKKNDKVTLLCANISIEFAQSSALGICTPVKVESEDQNGNTKTRYINKELYNQLY